MALQDYKIDLNGVGSIQNPKVRLENNFPVLMESTNSKDWTGYASLDVIGDLDYLMECFAMSGTDWDFTITNVNTTKVLSLSGTTGEKTPNMSRRAGSTKAA
jgi:hypothetical protein